jgi:DNA-binding CsgD family transcriptional regulator
MADGQGVAGEVRRILEQPFAAYPALDANERKAATLRSRGMRPSTIARMMGVSRRSAYRILDRAAAKIAAQDRRKGFDQDDLVGLVFERLWEVVTQ